MAARAGANKVVACDIHASLCDVARKAAAANGLSARVNVVQRDVGLLQRGREVGPRHVCTGHHLQCLQHGMGHVRF